MGHKTQLNGKLLPNKLMTGSKAFCVTSWRVAPFQFIPKATADRQSGEVASEGNILYRFNTKQRREAEGLEAKQHNAVRREGGRVE